MSTSQQSPIEDFIDLAALREREALYRNAIAAADAVVYQKEFAENSYTYMGAAITDLIGYDIDEVTPDLWFKIITQVEMYGPVQGKSQSELRRLFSNGELPVWRGDYKCTTKNGETRWLNDSAVPIHDRAGQVVGCLGVLQNITDRKLAEERLRQSEERFALALEATSEGLWDWNIATGEMFCSPPWCKALGFDPSKVEPHIRFWNRLTHPEDMPRVTKALNAHFQQKTELFECEVRLRTKSGEYRWILDRGKVVARDENGKPLRMVGINVDITERKQAEEALRLSEERLMSALVASKTGTWRVDLRTGFDTRDASLNQMLGLPAEPSTQPVEDWFTYVHPDDADAMNLAWQRGLESGLYSVEHRLIRCDGQVLWVYDRGEMIRDDEGQLDHAIGAVMDITERKQAEESRAMLSRELDHRVKNNLTSVIALAQLTAQSTDSIKDYVKLFTNRITSLARVHETLANKRWKGIELEELVRVAIGPFHAYEQRLKLSGPEILVSARNVQPLALVMHELLSNAARHGSLSTEDGIVEVKWQRDAQRVVIDWSEHGGPPIANPQEFGVGLRLVSGFVEKEIGGNLEVDFNAKGFRCVIQLPEPLDASGSGDET